MSDSSFISSHLIENRRSATHSRSAPAAPEQEERSLLPQDRPSRTFQEEAFSYVTAWCRASREFIKKKVERWKLLEDLYHNRRELNSWGSRPTLPERLNRAGVGRRTAPSRDRWQADIVLSPSYIVDTWADRAYQAVFSGPEWLTVVPENPQGPATEEIQFPASYKLQELLLTRLTEGQIHVRLYEILQHLVLYGSVFAKVFWYSREVRRNRWDHETLEVIQEHERIYDCPIIQVIPLDRVLVDWNATHGDVQRHTGIGHCVDKTYEHIIEQYRRGVYNLNREELLERWRQAPAPSAIDGDELLTDEDSEGLVSDEIGKFTIWEWHGRVPTENGHRECLCTFVTERGADSPEDGIMVRLTDGPVLWSGLRPFLTAHFTPLPGPLGMGAVEGNLDLIHSISQFLSQSQDNARLTANAQIIVRRGSSASRQISAENDVIYPGKVWTVDDPGDIQPFPPLSFPQQEVNHLIDYLNGLLERRTTVSDITLGVASQRKTATEAHILQDASIGPFATRTDLFARSFLEPLGKIALSMLQQFLLENQTITVRDFSGRDVPLVITPEEIQRGRYRVVATITKQDSSRLAKAQSIERVLPTLVRFQPLLAAEGVRISFSEMIKRYLDLIGVDGADRVINRIRTAEGGMQPSAGMSANASPAMEPDAPEKAAGAGGNLPPRLVENGGPMGPEPTDANALAQFLQLQAQGAVTS